MTEEELKVKEEELAKKEKRLNDVEKEIKKQCDEIDEREKNIVSDFNELNNKNREIKESENMLLKKMSCQDKNEIFLKICETVDEITRYWILSTGSIDNLQEVLVTMLQTRMKLYQQSQNKDRS